MSLVEKKNRSSEFPTRTNTNQTLQPQKKASNLKFLIYKVEGLYHSCCGNKGAEQPRSYCPADLRLCFRICKKSVFSYRGSDPCYENKGADQLSSYCADDLRLCFHICKKSAYERKPVLGVSDQDQHKLDFAATEES